jgi:SulP family sulfate permease
MTRSQRGRGLETDEPSTRRFRPRQRTRSRATRGDVLAGTSVAFLLIPQSLAYAQLAGMPAVRGLYASAIPPLAAAPFSSSPYLQPGPTAISALLTFGALAPLAVTGSPEYVALGLGLAVIVGVIRVLVGLSRLGFIAYLLSQPMLLGFVPAAGILILASQLPIALGAKSPNGGVLRQGAWALVHPGEWQLSAIALSLTTVVLLVLGPRVHRLIPVVLLAAAVGIVYSKLTDYSGATIGAISAGFLPFSLNLPWSEFPSLLVPGAVIALLGFTEAAAIARTYAALEREGWDPDREFVAQGMANLAAGVSGGFPVGSSFSRSALNRLAGARTPFSAIVTGLVVLAMFPAASALSPLPLAVLATIVMVSIVGLVRVMPLLRLVRLSRPQFIVAGSTFVLTFALSPHVERAVLVGIGLSVAVHLWRELSLEIPHWIEHETLHLRPRGVLWFGSAARLEDTFLRLLGENRDAKRLHLHLDGLGRIDMTGALALRGLLCDAREAGLLVDVVDVRPRWHGLVDNVISSEEDPLGVGPRHSLRA